APPALPSFPTRRSSDLAARWPAPEDGYGPLRGMIEQRMAHRVASLRLDRRVDQRTYATREGPHTFGGRCESRVRLQPERRAGQGQRTNHHLPSVAFDREIWRRPNEELSRAVRAAGQRRQAGQLLCPRVRVVARG